MTEMLDCLVSYIGLDENERPTYQRYFCYHIVAAPVRQHEREWRR